MKHTLAVAALAAAIALPGVVLAQSQGGGGGAPPSSAASHGPGLPMDPGNPAPADQQAAQKAMENARDFSQFGHDANTPQPTKAELMAAVTPLIAATAVSCTPTDAVLLGAGKKVKVYETACQEGLGYIFLAPTSGKPVAADCLAQAAENEAEMQKKSGGKPKAMTACTLAQNINKATMIEPLFKPSGENCSITDARYVGTSTTSQTSYYEIACAGTLGYMLGVKAGKYEKVVPCASASGLGGCTLGPKIGG